jgi:molecular chaperone DnaJ
MEKDFNYYKSQEHAYDDGGGEEEQTPGTVPDQLDLVLPFKDAMLGCTKALAGGLSIQVPAGTEDGTRLEINSGDQQTIVWIQVEEDPQLSVRDGDLVSITPLTLSAAVFGGSITVPSLEDYEVKTSIGPGVQHGCEIRLPGLGVPRAEGRGDLLAVLHIQVPTQLNRRQKKILKEFERLNHDAA